MLRNQKSLSILVVVSMIAQLLLTGLALGPQEAKAAGSSGPVLNGMYPNGASVPRNTDLILTFDEPVRKGTGSIRVRKVNDNTEVAAYEVSSSSYVAIQPSENVVRVNLSSNLVEGTSYYVLVDSGAFISKSTSINYQGLNNASLWKFTVVASDNTAPTVSVYNPAISPPSNTVPAASNLSLTFSENVYATSGYITVQKRSGDAQVLDVNSTSVQGSGSSTITIIPSTPLSPATTYDVTIPSGVFIDGAGNSYTGISGTSWSFRTADPAMLTTMMPEDNALSVSPTAPLVLSIKDPSNNPIPISKGTGSIMIKRISDNSLFQQFNITDSSLTISGHTLTIPHSSFQANTGYYVLADPGVLKDAATGFISYQGITDATLWNFSTTTGLDTIAPTVSLLSPLNNANVNVLSANLEMTFSESVYAGTGDIVIRNASTGGVLETIPVTSSKVTGAGSNKIIINPAASFANNTTYYVTVSSQAFRDLVGNNYAGISSSYGWTFRASQDAAAPIIAALSPDNGAINMGTGSTLTATFNEPISIVNSVGEAFIRKNGTTAGAVSAVLSLDPNDSTKLIITPSAQLEANTAYYVEIGSGAIEDLAGNDFVGILNEYRWSFRTIGSDTAIPQVSKVELTNSTRIVLTYNEALDSVSIPSAASFYVTVNNLARAVTAVAVSGQTVSLTLQSGVVYGQAVKLAYTKSTSGGIKDLSGNQAASFSSRDVTNAPDSTLPVPLSGSANGSLVTLVFNEELAAVNSAANSQFYVYVGGTYYSVLGIYGVGSTLMLTMNGTVASGQTVSVGYTPSSYPIRDLAGNAVAGFSSFYVTNGLDAAAPVLQTIAASGTKVTLTYSEGLNSSYVPLANQFTVLAGNIVRAVSYVEVVNNQVILTLTSSLTAGQSVLVSYMTGSVNTRDLAGNQAAAFTSVPAGSSSGTAGVQGAVAKGATVTITFNETLNGAFVPTIYQFIVKVKGVPYSISRVEVAGAAAKLTLATPASIGETVTVSYTNTGLGLRTVSNKVIDSFSDLSAANQTTWLDSLSGDYEAADGGGIGLKTSAASLSTASSPAGFTANQYLISGEKLTTAYQAARTAGQTKLRAVFKVPSTEKAAIVALPLSTLLQEYRYGSQSSFAVQYQGATYEVPLSTLDFEELGRLLGASAGLGNLFIEIEQGATSLTSGLTTAITRAKAQVIAGPTNFEASVAYSGAKQPIKEFKSYVTRSFETTSPVTPGQTAVVWVDPQTGVLSYVPTTVTTSGGKSVVTFKRKGNSAYALVRGAVTYTDISKHWARADIAALSNKYIVEGRSGGLFAPDKAVTRAEFAVFIARGLGLTGDKSAASKFADVNTATTLAAYIGAASKAGIVQGNPDGTFKPNNTITRQEMAAMMVRAANAAGVNVQLSSTGAYLGKFKDSSRISSWAQTDVAKAVYAGIINGKTTTTFSPATNATRAEAVVMIKRMLDYVDFISL
ncbi:Ig-like domain-containing protein [Paenibacillus sp. GCM10023252]|uniref:Ig-like domain-containing protein n=1 Tax=Paenibacillus sp. GCM10023252 TaxID=3252649 RepID=UPI00361EBB3C